MSSVSMDELEQPVYALQYASNTSEETNRLDEMHNGIKAFLGGALSFAMLDDPAPKTILELGCGSGAWAIQAAKTFPDAQVLAVDLSPMPLRDLPPNLTFEILDLTKPFPFERDSFDVVHERFVYIHTPNFEDVLKRSVDLVRPGGWLLMDDIENTIYDHKSLGPGQKTFWEAFHKYMNSKGVYELAPCFYEDILKASGSFSEVNIKKFVVPMSRRTRDRKISNLGATFKTSLRRAIQTIANNPRAPRILSEVAKEAQEEMDDCTRDLYINLYFTWSRKRV